MKLTTSTLKAHLLKAYSTNEEVRAAYNRPSAKGSSIFIQEVPVRMFTLKIGHWLTGCPLVPFRTMLWMVGLSSISVSKWTPDKGFQAGAIFKKDFLQRGYGAAKRLAVYLLYFDSAVWLSSDACKSRYGKFSLISLTVHFLDDEWNYRAVPVRVRNFKGKMRVLSSLTHLCDDMLVAAVHKQYLPYLSSVLLVV